MIKSITKMEEDFNTTNAQQVNYYVYIFKVILLEYEKKYDEAILLYKKFIPIIQKSKVLYSEDRIGFTLTNLGYFHASLNNYLEALKYYRKAQKYHIPNSISLTILREHEFYCLFYLKDYFNAEKSIDLNLKHLLNDIGSFRQSKFTYGKAYIFFATKRYKETLLLVNKPLEIEKDKGGLNVGIRILLIMTFIELNKYKEAKTSITASLKFLERNKIAKEIKERDILILKLLNELEKEGFNRRIGNKKISKLISELSDKDKPTAWKHFSPELIPFDEWVMTRPVKI